MKTMIMGLITAMAMSASLAIASPSASPQSSGLNCRDLDAGPDYGYYLKFNADLTRVEVSHMTIAGPQKLSELVCFKSFDDSIHHPDELVTIDCREEFLADGGYSVNLLLGGIGGLRLAALNEVTFFGSNEIARLTCE